MSATQTKPTFTKASEAANNANPSTVKDALSAQAITTQAQDEKDKQIAELMQQLANKDSTISAMDNALQVKEKEVAKLAAALPVMDYITLKGQRMTFSVIVDGKKCLFVNQHFTTRDRLLANRILSEFENIIEVKDEPILTVSHEVSQVI